MLTYNAIGIYVLVVSLLSVFVIVLVIRQGRTQKNVFIWVLSGLAGILLGAAGAGAVVQALGYELSSKFVPPAGMALTSTNQEAVETRMPTGRGMGMGGGMPMAAPCCAMGTQDGSPVAASPRVQLAVLVHKVNLLTSDISLHLSDAQAAALVDILTGIKPQQAISDDQAAALQKQIPDQFDEAQKAKTDSIRWLPPSAAFGSQSVQECVNPFERQQNAQALQSLLDRLRRPAAAQPAAAPAPWQTAHPGALVRL